MSLHKHAIAILAGLAVQPNEDENLSDLSAERCRELHQAGFIRYRRGGKTVRITKSGLQYVKEIK